jgi:uronate dehydrogenase
MSDEASGGMSRVLITGAAGTIGRRLRALLAGVYPVLRLSDIKDPEPAAAGEEVARADLAQMDQVMRMCEGVDGIVHLGGQPTEAPWETILGANIEGTYNLYEAARRQGVKRVVFATTNHVIGFYRRETRIDHAAMVRPDSRYGVSKAFGEALARFYADKYGIRTLAIRIGNFDDRPVDKRRLSIWISPRDLAQLVRIGLDHPEIHFEVVYGESDNERSWWHNANAFRLGYKPQDHSEDFAAEVLEAEKGKPVDPIAEQFQGGPFCSAEFAGDPSRVR